ncbi:transposable element Tcb1 transposase [Trichonephila clavipes]|nr:transposable element Tcb1 transposase [Trichonephila clavipes]
MPIENMWSMVAQRLTQITRLASTPDQLWQRVEAAWSAVPQEHIQSLFESMQRRVAAVISNNGGYSGHSARQLFRAGLDEVKSISSSGIHFETFPVTVYRTATAGSDVVQSIRPIFDDFFQYLWPYIGNNTANVVFQMVKRL